MLVKGGPGGEIPFTYTILLLITDAKCKYVYIFLEINSAQKWIIHHSLNDLYNN